MGDAATVVRSTTTEMAHSGVCLPAPVISVVTAFTRVRKLWRWIRLGKIYTNPNNFLKLAAGHTLNLAFGNNVILRVSAICVLIATRILECVEQHFALQRSWDNLVSAFKGRFPTPIKVEWAVKATNKFLSISTVVWWKYQFKHIWEVIKRIAVCILKLVKEAFILSMRIADAIESFTLSPTVRNEGINLLFVNGALWMDRLVENKDLLVQGLNSNKRVIERILKGIHAPFSAEQLIDVAKGAMDKTEKVHLALEKVSDSVGMFLVACLKKWGFEFMHALGLHHLIPQSLLPTANPPWVTAPHEDIKVRFPPQKYVTKPSMLKKDVKTFAVEVYTMKFNLPAYVPQKAPQPLVIFDKKHKKQKSSRKTRNVWEYE